MKEMFLTFGKSQLTRDEMRIISGGDVGFAEDGDSIYCKKTSCGGKPCAEFDSQSGSWFCSRCCV
ncbi:hypothetical protein [Paucihalobacter sp.]|uniref:hypothetical protein n=1 Tax=Paucihalobacter sp. TaxID=2850405 RepID=UPI003D162134